ncbi:MAG: HAMP domain-containing histidine kinase [Caloramator sp.]|nr:HAMP domain-containing histidine kinase [Caloramator sp.]
MVIIIKDEKFNDTLKIKMLIFFMVNLVCFIIIMNISAYYILKNLYFSYCKNDIMSRAENISKEILFMDDRNYANNNVIKDAIKSGLRVVIIDKDKKVIYDSFNLICGEKLVNIEEVDNVLKGQENFGKHITKNEKLLYVYYPVIQNKNVVRAVFLLYSLKAAYEKFYEFQRKLMVISISILIIGFIMSYVKAWQITYPLEEVISAIEAVERGELKKKVFVKGNDEIARLCYVFNKMNEKISRMDEERRRFIADASHELKSPLASIKVLVQSLLMGGIEDKKISIEFLKDIDDEINRLTVIVNDLLELSKLEDKNNISFNLFDISDVCSDVVKRLNPIASVKNINIRSNFDNAMIEGNKEGIFRAIYNILENAIKYSNENSFIDIWIEKENMVKINIKDYGIGIPKEDIPNIFKRFYRVDKTRDRKTGGSGLGLPIAYEIIKLHKGDIKVSSKVGEGSLFTITLPYKLG